MHICFISEVIVTTAMVATLTPQYHINGSKIFLSYSDLGD